MTRNGKMFSFGSSREAYDRVYYKERIPADRAIPGPGTYELSTTLGKNSLKFSITGRVGGDCKSEFTNNDGSSHCGKIANPWPRGLRA